MAHASSLKDEGYARNLKAMDGSGLGIPGPRGQLPFPLECARQKVIICMASGKPPAGGDSGGPQGSNAWLGVSKGAVRAAKEGYLPDLQSPMFHVSGEDETGSNQWPVNGPGGYQIDWQSWGLNLTKCALCLKRVTNLLWWGSSKQRPTRVPRDPHPRPEHASGAFTFGPKEGPRGCRVLVCPSCYVEYGPRVCLAVYPPMTSDEVLRCKCMWLGYSLATCKAHEGVRFNPGIHLTKGQGFLQAGEAPVRRGAAGRGGISFRGSMEALDSLQETALEKVINCSFPRPPPSRGNRLYLNKGPASFYVMDTPERQKLFSENQSASDTEKLRGVDLHLDSASLIRMMLAVRAKVSQPELIPVPFQYGSAMPKGEETFDWLTEVSGKIPGKGFRELLSIELIVRNGPKITKKGSGSEPVAIGSTTRPVELEAYQSVIFMVTLEVGPMPHPVLGIFFEVVPGGQNPVVGDPKQGSLIKPRRVHFPEGAGPGKRQPSLWEKVSNFSLSKTPKSTKSE